MSSKFTFYLITFFLVSGLFYGFSNYDNSSVQKDLSKTVSGVNSLGGDLGNVLVIMHDSTASPDKRKADRDTMYKYLPGIVSSYTTVFTDTSTVLPDLADYKTIILQETSFDISSLRYLGLAARDQIKSWLNTGTGLSKKILISIGADQGYNYSRAGSNARDLDFSDNFCKFIFRIDNGNSSNPREITGVGIDSGNIRSMTSSPPGGGFYPDGCSMSAGGHAFYKYPAHTDSDTLAAIGIDGGTYLAVTLFSDPRYFTGEFGEVLTSTTEWILANSACPFTDPIRIVLTDTNNIYPISCFSSLSLHGVGSYQFNVTATGNPDELITLTGARYFFPSNCDSITFDPPLPITQTGEIQVSVTVTNLNTGLCTGFIQFNANNYCEPRHETICRINFEDPLPVELTSFVSAINANNITLNWITTSETNNSGFDIERTSENGTWTKVGNVTGNGSSVTGNSYSFTDRNVASGKYNYRLKQIDYNGNFEYFNLENEVNVGTPEKFELAQNYPNPFNPSTRISFSLPVDSKVSIKVFDVSGKEVATILNENKTAGYYTINFNASGLSSGVYFYNITAENFTSTKKMMLLR